MVSQSTFQSFETEVPKPVFNLLVLIATTILADVRAHKSGSQTFISEARRLGAEQTQGVKLSEARLLLWYELNKDAILEKMRATGFRDWFYGVLASLNSFFEKHHILDMMQRITATDRQINTNGQALFILTKRYLQV